MCLIAFAVGASMRWPLVIASNRDEFLDRPTRPLARWQTAGGQEIISGRDLRAGGTWLGLTPSGRVAFLTNVREAEPKAGALSRGELVTGWLESSRDANAFAASLEKRQHHYAGFNLVLGDMRLNDWTWMTNRAATAQVSSWHAQSLPPGIYGLSNAALDTPWPKTVALKNALATALDRSETSEDADAGLDRLQGLLWSALGNRERVLLSSLPSTGVSEAAEAAFSSAFVEFAERGYGTISSTVVVASTAADSGIDHSLRIGMAEKTHLCLAMHETPLVSNLSFQLSF